MSRNMWSTTYRNYDGEDENDIGPQICEKPLLSKLRKFFYRHVVIDTRQQIKAQKIVEDIIKQFEIYTKFNSKYQFGSIFRQGSSYEGLKVMQPNEFDLLVPIQLPVRSVELMEAKDAPGYYYIQYSGDTWQKCTRGGFLNPVLVSREMQSIIQKAINFMRQKLPGYKINIHESGPAKTLNINDTIDIDMVPAVELSTGDYLVAKRHPKADLYQSKNPIGENMFNHLWRQSYSEKEKEEIRNIDKTGECHRACLKILKTASLMNCKSQLGFLSSYHLKTCMLHLNKRNVGSWHEDNLDERFKDLIQILISSLERKELLCFFNDGVNLFEDCSSASLENLKYWLQKSVRNDEIIIKRFLTNNNDDLPQVQSYWDGGEKHSDNDNGNEKDSDDYYYDDEDTDDYRYYHDDKDFSALDTNNSAKSTADGMAWFGKTLLVGAGIVGIGLLAARAAGVLSGFKVKVYSRREHTTVTYRGLERSLTVMNLKTKIMNEQGPPVYRQRLRFNGMVLEDSRTLGYYDIGEDDTIVLETE